MIPIETRITVWLGLSAKLLMCVILLASVYFHAEKRAEKVSQEKILLIENRLKKGGVLCFFRRQSFWRRRFCCKMKGFLLFRLLLR